MSGPLPQRIDVNGPWPAGYAAMRAFGREVAESGLDPGLQELVRIRASQLNGCAYCLDMHTKDARARGESEQRLYALSCWREAPFFTELERAALALTEAVTFVASTHELDAAVDEAKSLFDEAELAQLVFTIIVINAWNRLAIVQRLPVGNYRSSVATQG